MFFLMFQIRNLALDRIRNFLKTIESAEIKVADARIKAKEYGSSSHTLSHLLTVLLEAHASTGLVKPPPPSRNFDTMRGRHERPLEKGDGMLTRSSLYIRDGLEQLLASHGVLDAMWGN